MSYSLKTFPVRNDRTVIPPNFAVQALDLRMPDLAVLTEGDCKCIALVNSPVGWKSFCRGKNESPHIDLFIVISGSIEFRFEKQTELIRAGKLIICPSWFDRYVSISEQGVHLYCQYNAVERFPQCTGPEHRPSHAKLGVAALLLQRAVECLFRPRIPFRCRQTAGDVAHAGNTQRTGKNVNG